MQLIPPTKKNGGFAIHVYDTAPVVASVTKILRMESYPRNDPRAMSEQRIPVSCILRTSTWGNMSQHASVLVPG